MIFQLTRLTDVTLVDLDAKADDRGFFARVWCRDEFAERGLAATVAQINTSFCHRRGTLRGLHYQVAPQAEAKLVRCVAGAVFDVAVDLRPASPTYRQWFGVELSADDRRMLYIPPGCAHGYQALTDGAEIIYLASRPYAPACERGLRHDDPAFAIAWPLPVGPISAKDSAWPDYRDPLTTPRPVAEREEAP